MERIEIDCVMVPIHNGITNSRYSIRSNKEMARCSSRRKMGSHFNEEL